MGTKDSPERMGEMMNGIMKKGMSLWYFYNVFLFTSEDHKSVSLDYMGFHSIDLSLLRFGIFPK